MGAWLTVIGASLLAAQVAPPLATVVCFTVAAIAFLTVGFLMTGHRQQ